VDRRAFLGTAAGVGLLAACSSSPPTTPAATTSSPGTPVPPPASPTGTPRPHATGVSGPPDWAGLARGLSGSLLRPGQDGYDGARRLFDPRYDSVRPAAVALVANAQDVAECVRFAARYRLPITARGGGHSYGGFSTGTGLVVNLSQLSTVDISGGAATVGAGTNLITLYNSLAARDLGVPAGSCPTVGVSGSTMGGGIGVAARGLGLTCDTLTGATVVTADGQVRQVAASRDPDLFWALRGGGGGNFGIVTALRYKARSVDPVTYRFLRWPWSRATRVLPAWLSWVHGGPDELWSNLHLDAAPGGAPSLRATVTYLGDGAAADRQVDRLLSATGAPGSQSGATEPWLSTMKVMAGCSEQSLAQCVSYTRQSWAGSSDVIAKPLSGPGAAALVRGVEGFNGSISVIIDALGGAVGRVGKTDTAFWHRDALCTVQYYATLSGGAGATGRYAGLAALRRAMRPYTTGGAYVNYLDPTLPGWEQAYYGGNYPRLQKIKAAYDPQRVFTFAQSIR
jgi:FAD/FMN-containing dehydrogenase